MGQRRWLPGLATLVAGFLAAASAGASTATFTYDANGNRTGKTEPGVAWTYLYDTQNRLIEVQRDGVLVEAYRYDSEGHRISKSGADGLARYVWDGDQLVAETDGFGNTVARYHRAGSRLVEMVHATEGASFYFFDALGSPVALSKPDGTLRARYLWDVWGNLRSQAGASANPFGFTGYQRDAGSGLLYAGARYYDAELGSFTSADPFEGDLRNPPSLHRFLYAWAQPTVVVDPTGKFGVFFDGTWNNKDRRGDREAGRLTNVAKLFDAYDTKSGKHYARGVGTTWKLTKHIEGFTGLGAMRRVETAYESIVRHYNKTEIGDPSRVIDIFGFSRGSAEARMLANLIRTRGIPDRSRIVGYKEVAVRGGNGEIRQVRVAPVYENFSDVQIRFLGLFDTVAAFGWPTNGVNVGWDLSVHPEAVGQIRQAAAADEFRFSFDLMSIEDPTAGTQESNVVERYFRGAHSDVGGGYARIENGRVNDLAKVPLAWMYNEAFSAGVPLKDLRPDDLPPQGLEDLPEAQLRGRYIHNSRYAIERLVHRQRRTVYYPGFKKKESHSQRQMVAQSRSHAGEVTLVEESENGTTQIPPHE